MKKVIIIGASYAGLSALKELSKDKNIEVVIFDKNSYHYLQVESYTYISNVDSQESVLIDIKTYINKLNNKNISFVKEEVEYFDSIHKKVICSNSCEYSYDELIIATGALTNFPPQVPNIKKYSSSIKTLQKAKKARENFIKTLSETSSLKDEYNVLIAGAGLSGVEIACEMAVLLKNSSLKNQRKINIILVEGMNTVLPNMNAKLVNSCKDRLEKLGVKLFLGSFIKDVEEKNIYLANDVIISYDNFIFTGGVKALTINSQKEHEVNKINQYITDDYLRIKGELDVFAIGDVAQIMYENKYIAPSAQIASKSASYVASYIKNSTYDVFIPSTNGVLIALGGKYAIALLFNKIFIKGYFAYLIKSFISLMHKRKFS